MAASTIAHEAIYNLRAELVARGLEEVEHDRLLAESAQITSRDLPEALAAPRRLAAEWQEAALLDVDRAAELTKQLSGALDACQPSARALLSRQREIASTLHAQLAAGAAE